IPAYFFPSVFRATQDATFLRCWGVQGFPGLMPTSRAQEDVRRSLRGRVLFAMSSYLLDLPMDATKYLGYIGFFLWMMPPLPAIMTRRPDMDGTGGGAAGGASMVQRF